MDVRDIVVTWPKGTPLGSYLANLELAKRDELVINYRVARLPSWDDAIADHDVISWPYGVEHPRCYMVHDGAVRGWCEILYCCERADGEVDGWPAGLYLVRSPEWHPLERPVQMAGFRGWRWFDRRRVPATVEELEAALRDAESSLQKLAAHWIQARARRDRREVTRIGHKMDEAHGECRRAERRLRRASKRLTKGAE